MTGDGRLDPEEAASILASAKPIKVRAASPIAKVSLHGVTQQGEPITLDMRHTWRLLLFVSSTCHGCRDLLAHLEDGGRFGLGMSDVVLVSHHGDDVEVPGITSLMSDDLWRAYGVSGPPFFSLIHAEVDTVVTEGVAWGVASITDAVSAALEGRASTEVHRLS